MLVATLRFPMGVYHALGAGSGRSPGRREPEWPPSPVRLIGALLDAAHGQLGGADAAALSAVSRLASAGAPVIVAPDASAVPSSAEQVSVLAGPSRWAPRNPVAAETKVGLSLRDLPGPRAAVDKGGVAIGDRPIAFLWPDFDPDPLTRGALAQLATDVAWFGTSRSPVILGFGDELPLGLSDGRWVPRLADDPRPPVNVRVPHSGSVEAFDAEFARRRSARGKIESSGLQKPASAGVSVGYSFATDAAQPVHDPRYWGHSYVLEVSTESPVQPKAPAAYLVARAVRAAVLAQFGAAGSADEAPELLRGRGSTPHAAFVPLPFVGSPYADGSIKGIAILLPHPQRLGGDLTTLDAVERGLASLVDQGPGGQVNLLGAGKLELRETVPLTRPLASLDLRRYAGPSTSWETVTPVVHSHWRAAKSPQALVDQVAADCAHVGLPVPVRIEVQAASELRGAPSAFVDRRGLKEEWLGPISGPAQHLRLEFPVPVRGPILLGRARHFGLGLLRPRRGEVD